MKLYIAGRRGAGKTTAATILQERYGACVVQITDPLYEIARSYFGMTEKDRLLLQRIGDAFRSVDPTWLAQHAARRLESLSGLDQMQVIEGVRTSEEAFWLNEHGWVGMLIEAPEEVRRTRREGEPSEADLHHTETQVDFLPVHLLVRNIGTQDELVRALTDVVEFVRRMTQTSARIGGAMKR